MVLGKRIFFPSVLSALLLTTVPLFGQGRSDEVRSLNNSVLRLQDAFRRANAAERAQIQIQANDALARRAAALTALIKENPASALTLAFDQNLLNELASSFPGAASRLERQGEWEGTSNHLVFDDPDRQVRKYLVQIEAGNDRAEVYSAAGEPHCVSGDRIAAQGVRIDNVIAAGNVNVQGGGTAAAAALSCSTTGVQNVAVLLVQFPTISLPSGVTPSMVNSIFFNSGGKSVNDYWYQASFGKTSATGAVFGPFTLNRTYTCDEYNAMRTAAIAAADPTVDFRNYTRIFVVFPNPGGCSWAGLGTLGCSTLSSADGSFTASTSWLLASYMSNLDQGVKLSTHEGGHNLTLHHASSRGFGGEALGPVGAAGTLSEYGDVFSTMGSWNLGQYGAPHKVRLGWLSGSNVEAVENNASRTIAPYEINTGALQALKVRRGTGNNAWLWLEYRQSVAPYDSTLPSQAFTGALIHYEDSTTGTHTHLLDFTPATSSFGDSALTGTWSDPYTNLTLSVTSATSTGLAVNVSYGSVPCTPAAPTVTLSPSSASVNSGSSVVYTATIKNNDATSCSSSTFNMSATLPATWNATFTPASLTLTPGQSSTTQVSVSVPAGYASANYSISVTASDGVRSVTANASCNVSQPPPPAAPITISLFTVTPLTLTTKDSVTIQATVVDSNTNMPVQGASVTFKVIRPNNAATTATVATNAYGVAAWSYKPPQKGSYAASATATLSGQTATQGPIVFNVN